MYRVIQRRKWFGVGGDKYALYLAVCTCGKQGEQHNIFSGKRDLLVHSQQIVDSPVDSSFQDTAYSGFAQAV